MMTENTGGLVSTLYHVTIGRYIDSIQSEGISADYAVSKFKVSWFVSKGRIPWAILHVANRHAALIDDIFVCPTLIEWAHMRNCGKQGVYYTFKTYRIEYPSPSIWFIQDSE